MASSLDMSLDDRIKNNRSIRGRGRGRGKALAGRGSGTVGGGRRAGAVNGRRVTGNGGRTTGAVRRGPLMVNTRPSSYAIAKSIRRTKAFPWQSDLFEDSLRAAGIQGVEVDTKLYVSNLDRGVTNEDIRELFSELGDLKRYAVHYDKNGHPTGSAEVVYNRRSDAFAALKRYNNVLLDGKPMKIEIVGTNSELPVTARVNVSAMNGQRKRTVVMTPRGGRGGGPAMLNRGAGWGRRGGSRGGSGTVRGRGRGRPGRGGGRGRGRKDGVEKSAEQLDPSIQKTIEKDYYFSYQLTIMASLLFTVQRHSPEFVKPLKPTPHEIKLLSDIDDQDGLRFQIPVIQFYKYDPKMKGKDPVDVIRKALAKTLVFYYPFAGRLREGPGRKLMVDCNDEGVLFIEADADVRLEEFGDALQPPFPCLNELLFDVPGSSEVLNTPLLLIQVTRLKCGGFIFALRLNHTMSDAAGLTQFMSALGEISCGLKEPSIAPVWQRELLNARVPPRVTCNHREYEQIPDTKGTIIPLDDMAHRSFFFGPTEVASIRALLPPHQQNQSNFEILTACLWRCRTIALQPDNDEEVRIICIVNARGKFNPPLPNGYYGNTFAFPVAVTTAGKLIENPLGYALELVKKAKADVTEEYMHSVADLMVIKNRPHFTVVRSFLVSDVTRAAFGEVDFGWGKAFYGGPAKGGVGAIPGVASFYIPFKNAKGETGLVIPVCLPNQAMERFVKELDNVLKNNINQPTIIGGQKSSFIISSL